MKGLEVENPVWSSQTTIDDVCARSAHQSFSERPQPRRHYRVPCIDDDVEYVAVAFMADGREPIWQC